jgi:hypothetical protein
MAASSPLCRTASSLTAAAPELFQRALRGASLAFHARLEVPFAKQGTAIAVRLLVIDKFAGSINTVINRATVADLVPFLSKLPPRRRVTTELALVAAPPVSPAKTTSTFGRIRSATESWAQRRRRSDANGTIPGLHPSRHHRRCRTGGRRLCRLSANA